MWWALEKNSQKKYSTITVSYVKTLWLGKCVAKNIDQSLESAEMAHWLRALTAFAEDPGSIPSTNTAADDRL